MQLQNCENSCDDSSYVIEYAVLVFYEDRFQLPEPSHE